MPGQEKYQLVWGEKHEVSCFFEKNQFMILETGAKP